MQKTGGVISARVVSNTGDITLISRDGIMLRTAIKSIPQQGRATSGVRVMSLKGNDVVASAAVLIPEAKQPSSDPGMPPANGPMAPPVSPSEMSKSGSDSPINGHEND
jgi:DNA gyrase subunit A